MRACVRACVRAYVTPRTHVMSAAQLDTRPVVSDDRLQAPKVPDRQADAEVEQRGPHHQQWLPPDGQRQLREGFHLQVKTTNERTNEPTNQPTTPHNAAPHTRAGNQAHPHTRTHARTVSASTDNDTCSQACTTSPINTNAEDVDTARTARESNKRIN